MKYFVVVILSSIIPYLQADPCPDIHIQNYDGPIFLQSLSPNCCPLCDSILRSHQPNTGLETIPSAPEVYPKKAIYGAGEDPIITGNPETVTAPVVKSVAPVENCLGPAEKSILPAENQVQKILHNKDTATSKVTYNVPVTSVNTIPTTGNSYPLNTRAIPSSSGSSSATNFGAGTYPVTGNTFPVPPKNPGAPSNAYSVPAYGHTYLESGSFCGTRQYPPNFTGTEYSGLTNPPSNHSPVNTGSQNSCYKVPIAAYNQGRPEDEPVLVPQKFSYSLILDGEVVPSFRQAPHECKCYCYC